MKKPNVFIVGAPKCGTTSLANWLTEHPQCFMSARKEPHFFGDYLRNAMTLDQYESLYEHADSSCQAVIDASTSYLANPEAIKAILKYNADAKFVVMLRNPVELVYAWHGECFFLGWENEKDFRKAWDKQNARKEGRDIPVSCRNTDVLFYFKQGCIGNHLEKLMAIAGKEKVHIIFLDDIKKDPRSAYCQLLEFLQLQDDGRTDFPTHNRAKKHRFPAINRLLIVIGKIRASLGLPGIGFRSWFNRFGKVQKERKTLDAAFESELYQKYEADIRLLENLTGRDLGCWRPAEKNSIG